MGFKLFVDCEKAGHVCDKAQYNEASFMERLRLRFHILYCNACKKHSIRNSKLTHLCNKANVETMSKDRKQHLESIVKEELSK